MEGKHPHHSNDLMLTSEETWKINKYLHKNAPTHSTHSKVIFHSIASQNSHFFCANCNEKTRKMILSRREKKGSIPFSVEMFILWSRNLKEKKILIILCERQSPFFSQQNYLQVIISWIYSFSNWFDKSMFSYGNVFLSFFYTLFMSSRKGIPISLRSK